MAQLDKRFIDFGTTGNEVNATHVPANRTATNYTPSGTSVKGHLDGVDSALGALGSTTGDIGHTSFSLANNQTSFANVTGLAFANGTTRSAQVQYSVVIDATSDLYEEGTLKLIQRGADWILARSFDGDDTLIEFDVTNAGQVQYKSANYSGFVSGTMKFRATTTQV